MPIMWPHALSAAQPTALSVPGHFPVEPATHLLAPFHRLIQSIRAVVGLPENHWQGIYLPVLRNYAELSQQLPASEAHHHAETGGLLRHGLETMLEALILRRSQLLPPGAPAEEIAKQQDLWTYAIATSALLHDVGKPITDIVVTYVLPTNGKPQRWQPLTSSLPAGAHYRFRFNAQRRYHRHALIPPLMAHRILPQAGLDWLASEPALFDAWLATISGDDNAGTLAAIAQEADGISVARDLSGGVRTRLPAARAKPLSERLLTGLRHMVKEGEVSLNRPGASGFVADGSLWLVSKRVLDHLREHLTKEGQTGIPSRNDRLMDELQQWHVIQPNGDKAVWYCNIQIGDWCQALTCLRMDVTQIWPSLKDVPITIDISVTPVDRDPEKQGKTTLDPAVALQPTGGAKLTADLVDGTSRTSSRHANDTLAIIHPAEPSGSYDDLPLPFDQPDAAKTTGTQPGPADTTCADPSPSTAGAVAPAPATMLDDNIDIGRRFVEWLTQNIREERVEINTPRARLHVLPQGLAMITPGIFRDFSPEHWDRAQKRFQKLKLHAKTTRDTNIWTCQVAKDRKRSTVKVMLIPDAETVLGVNIPAPNPAMTLINAT
ncbi:MAG: MobH family relaxase [Sedimenticolaceae bacterium]